MFGKIPELMLNRTLVLIFLFLIPSQSGWAQNLVQGRVFWDQNENCEWDSWETTFRYWPVVATADGEFRYSITDSMGVFEFDLPNATIDFYPSPPFSGPYDIEPCGPVSATITGDPIHLPLPVRNVAECAELSVSLLTSELAPDSFANIFLCYSNLGTEQIGVTKLYLDLDKNLEWLNETSITGDEDPETEIINLAGGQVPKGGSFRTERVLVKVNELGQFESPTSTNFSGIPNYAQQCDSVAGIWDSTTVIVEGECVLDSTFFRITNIGPGDMSASLDYVILQDDILGTTGTFQLDSGQSFETTFDGAGSFHRLIAEQSPFHPQLQEQSVLVDVCDVVETIEIPGNAPVEIIDNNNTILQQRIGQLPGTSTLTVFPRGICGNPNSYILKDERLYFTLHIRNPNSYDVTGVSARFLIPDQLDPSTLKIEGMTHNPAVRLGEQGLFFNFGNATIFAKNKSEDRDQAMVKFSMLPFQDVIVGEQLSTFFVTYIDGQDYISDSVDQLFVDTLIPSILCSPDHVLEYESGKATFYPNPTKDNFSILTAETVLSVRLYSLDGKAVRTDEQKGTVNVAHLENGLYLVLIETDQGIRRKKLIVQH